MSTWPAEITPVGAVACGTTLWKKGGDLHVTVIVKATFNLVHESVCKLGAPDALVRTDEHHDRSPARSLARAGDLVPYKPRADVTFIGHAYAARPVQSASIRLAVFRERALLDKTLHVYGERASLAAPPKPFQRAPIVYERAFGGPSSDDNPVGVGASGPDGAQPDVVAPGGGKASAGFGPISRYWPARKKLLGAAHRRAIEAGGGGPHDGIADIPDDIRWEYFQAAPPDQQIEFLQGDEWLVLDGLHPTLARLQTRLPNVYAVALVRMYEGGSWGDGDDVALAADTLEIDGDRQRCSVVWRGSVVVPGGEAGLARLRLFGGLELPGAPIRWPAAGAPPRSGRGLRPPHPRSPPLEQEQETTTSVNLVPPRPGAIDPSTTVTLTPEQGAAAAARPSAPFTSASPGPDPLGTTATLVRDVGARPEPAPPARVRPSDIPGAPWASSGAKRPPPPLGEDYATMLFVNLPLPAPPPALEGKRAPFPALEPDDPDEATTLHQPRPSRPEAPNLEDIEEIDPGDPDTRGS